MPDRIEGPFGFWSFPILNTIIKVVSIRNDSKERNVRVVRASELDDGDDLLEFIE